MWIKLETAKGEQLFPVASDAMSPTFIPGDIVSINIEQGPGQYDNPYLLELYGTQDVRRISFGVEVSPGVRGVAIRSDNHLYDDLLISYSEFETCAKLIGPVTRIYRALKPNEATEYGKLRLMDEQSRQRLC